MVASGGALVGTTQSGTWLSGAGLVVAVVFGVLGVIAVVVAAIVVARSSSTTTTMGLLEKSNAALTQQNELQAEENRELKHRNRVLESQLAALQDIKLASTLVRELITANTANHNELVGLLRGRSGS